MKTTNPPYLSVKKIENLFHLIGTRSFTSVDRKTLMESYGYSEGESSMAVSTLQFLGILNDDKTVDSNVMNAVTAKNEEKRIDGLSIMVKNAYADLFTAFEGVAIANQDELHDEFKRVYGITNRVAKPAVVAFVYFCELAGLREKTEKNLAKKTNTSGVKRVVKVKPKSKSETPVQSIPNGATKIEFCDGEVQILLPQRVLTNVNLLDSYKELVNAMNAFSLRYSEEYPNSLK